MGLFSPYTDNSYKNVIKILISQYDGNRIEMISQPYIMPIMFFVNDTNERSGAMLIIKKLSENFGESLYLITTIYNE